MLKNSKIYTVLVLVFFLVSGNCFARDTKDKLIFDPSDKGLVKYMRSLAKQKGSKFKIDLSDPKQNAFVLARLASFGKTTKNSPQLFKSLQTIKEKQTALKKLGLTTDYTTQSTAQTITLLDRDGIVDPNHHAVSNVAPSIVTNPEINNLVKAQVLSTVQDGTDMTYVDIIMRNEAGSQLGNPAFVESYAEGTDVRATATANYDWIKTQDPEAEIVVLDSMQINSINGQEEPPQYLMVNSILPHSTFESVQENYVRVEPTDKNGDDIIMLCLNRSHADCDYPQFSSLPNQDSYVRIPFKGEFTYNRRILHIYGYNDPELNPVTFDHQTGIYVYAKNLGGTTVLQNFSSYLRLDVDETAQTSTISWDIPREGGVFENSTLYARFEEVNWFLKINLKFSASWYNNRRLLDAQFSASTGEYADDFVLEPDMPKLKFAYSCIAAGTEIRMGDGSLMPIETIKEGMTVQAHGAVLPVTDVSIGIETIPMYRITDHKGNSVLLTESHPVITANRGIIWASEVKRGDRLKTEWGTTLVKSVSTEMFNDKIYNLKLGKGIQPSPGAHPLNAMFANGILVGDLSMQAAYEYKNAIDKEDVLSRLPEKWHQDFLNSLNK